MNQKVKRPCGIWGLRDGRRSRLGDTNDLLQQKAATSLGLSSLSWNLLVGKTGKGSLARREKLGEEGHGASNEGRPRLSSRGQQDFWGLTFQSVLEERFKQRRGVEDRGGTEETPNRRGRGNLR